MKSLLPLAIIAIVIAGYYMYIAPTLNEIQSLRLKKAEYKSALETTKEISDIRDARLASYNSIPKEDIERLSKIIPSTFDPVTLAASVNSSASRYGMVIRNVKIQEPKTNNSTDPNIPEGGAPLFKTITLSFTIKGRYDQLNQFLKEIEADVHLVDVINLNATQEDKTSANGIFTFNLDLHTYSLY